METGRKRIRKDFAPLNVSVTLSCESQYSPMQQVYDAALNQYEPDRALSPTVLRPIVTAHASDGSWKNPHANEALASMRWFVNGVDISTIPAWMGMYEIEQYGDHRGSLIIKKNIAPNTKIALHFEAVIADNRLGVTIPIKTEYMNLSTFDKSEDCFSMSMSDDRNITYNPFMDMLHLYEYKVAHGLISPSSQEEQRARDGQEYIRTIPIHLYKGGARLQNGYALVMYRVVNNSLTALVPGQSELISISATEVTIDLRLISKGDYMIKALIDGHEVSRIQFSVNRAYPAFTCIPANETPISADAVERYDEAIVNSDGNNVECPESIIQIVWKTDSAHLTGVTHNEGDRTVFALKDTGIGDIYTDDWLDVYTEAIQKDAYDIATDGNDILTDENGEVLIIN